MSISSNQIKALFKTGENKYDLQPNQRGVFETYLIHSKISGYKHDEIIGFLDYHSEGNPYPNVFNWVMEVEINEWDRLRDDLMDSISDWVCKKTGMSKFYVKTANGLFKEPTFSRGKNDEWESKLIKFISGKDSHYVIPFLEYGKEFLKQGYEFHLIECTHKRSCQTNDSFEHYIDRVEYYLDYCKDIVEKETAKQNVAPKNFDKIQWLGTQKQLGELFAELERKGWIEKPEYEAIKQCFTKSNTIHQVLKPTQNPKSKEKEYEGIYTTQYKPKFFGIHQNPKHK